jgi:hypothetical protein
MVLADAAETILCATLAATTLAGLVLFETFGWWQADPVAALAVAWFALREGREAWHGELVCDGWHRSCARQHEAAEQFRADGDMATGAPRAGAWNRLSLSRQPRGQHCPGRPGPTRIERHAAGAGRGLMLAALMQCPAVR